MDKFSLLSGYHSPVLADTEPRRLRRGRWRRWPGEIGAGARLMAREDEEQGAVAGEGGQDGRWGVLRM